MGRFEFALTPLAGVMTIERRQEEDGRGFLSRIYCREEFAAAGLPTSVAQINVTLTRRRGAIRGMHFQTPPHAETKLVSCLHGEIFDVALDLRRDSPTFLRWHAEVLSSLNRRALLLPEGVAHGFQALRDDCELLYLHTAAYAPSAEAAVNALDPRLGITWPLAVTDMSDRDRTHPMLTSAFEGIPPVNCRHCGASVELPLIDLGSAPYSNAYLTEDLLRVPEKWYPLRVLVCAQCWLAQTDEMTDRTELFSAEYAYFTSYSITALEHAERYVTSIVERFGLGPESHIVEVAANDGYLLQDVQARGIPCLGIEPTASTARAARAKGIDVLEEFFGALLAERLVSSGRAADLMVANNVLVHVPDINDFVRGFAKMLKPNGVATFEFPHLLRLVQDNLFDTIYHEHYSYLSLTTAMTILDRNGLAVFDVEEIETHGGSLRVFAERADNRVRHASEDVARVCADELRAGMGTPEFYQRFQSKVEQAKDDFVAFLVEAKRAGRRVAAYGAAAKGNTLMNFAGVRRDLISFVVDRNPSKQGRYMPGSRIPIMGEEALCHHHPDLIVLFPWNLRPELERQLRYVRQWGARMVTAVPRLEVS